jgi:hypothetical protein
MSLERLGHYTIVRLLGVGGMGEVYLAEDTKLRRQVALKVLPAAFSGDSERLARMRREARTLASLTHPFVGVALVRANYDTSPDGQRFLMLAPADPGRTASNRIEVVLNWTEELKRLARVTKK